MKIIIHSRESIEKLMRTSFPEHTAVISFYDPPEEGEDKPRTISFSRWTKRVFQIPLKDITYDELSAHKESYGTYFMETEELAGFILEAARENMDIICQCENGKGLSAGCAAAIHEYLFGDGVFIFADYHFTPNQMVFHKVYNALWLREKGRLDTQIAPEEDEE